MKGVGVYLDCAASVSPNPSSIHAFGVEANNELQNARAKVADILGVRVSEVIFTSGGTESNNLAIQGVILACLRRQAWHGKNLPHIVTTNIEHPSVLETCKMLEKQNRAQISIVSVESNGIVDPKKIKKAIKENTILVSVMYANNEIGTVQHIRDIAKEIRHFNKINSKKVYFHTDAVQAANYLDLNVERLGVDLLSISGLKIEGAGRVGMLYKKTSVSLANMFGGGDQEMGFRPGTENLPSIVKFGDALEFTQKIKEKEIKRLITLRDYFIHSLIRANKRIVVNGDLENRLPNNVNITIPNIPSDLLVIELSARGIMASAKSACKSGDGKASHVIEAINQAKGEDLSRRSGAEVDGSLRFSLGRQTTKSDIDYTVKALSDILKKLKKWYS